MSNAGHRRRLGSLALAVVILAGAAALVRAPNVAPPTSSPAAQGRDSALLSAPRAAHDHLPDAGAPRVGDRLAPC